MVLVVIGTIVALAWMCYRASTLLKIPIPTLVKLLGLDLPAPPRVSLHGIAADTITLHWSLPEKAGSVAKHIIQINGINVGESEKRGETSVTVTGLNPDHLYNVRVIAANSHNFQAPGQLIRLRTRRKSQSSNDAGASHVSGKTDSSEDLPSIHSNTPSLEPSSPHANSYHHHHHHHSNSSHHSRRINRERRNSPSTLEQQNQQNSQNAASPAEDQHSVESLTAALEVVRRDIDDTEAQLAHTEEEFKAAELVLRSELDLLKEKKNEEDSSRQKLRSETRALEEAKRAAEALRTKTDKSLRAKEDEIKKMRDDSLRWDEERNAALEKVKELSKEARESKERAQGTERELSEEMKDTQRNIAEMEEEIRALVSSIKASEAQREQWRAEEEAESARIAEDEKEEREWKIRQRKLETRYVNIYNTYQAAELDYMRSKELLMSSQSRRGSHGDVVPQKKAKQRRHRNRKSRTHTLSGPTNSFPLQDQNFPDPSAINNIHLQRQMGTAFGSSIMSSPFFNIANGAAPTEQPDSGIGLMSASMELERLSGGAPMSPTANSLLPSNLFSFEDSSPSPKGTSPLLEDAQLRNSGLDGLGLSIVPQSPQSSGSVSTSHLSSPGSSFHHIPLFPHMPDNGSVNDSERASSISPIGSLRQLGDHENVSGGRRFVKLFSGSFNRQRGKTIPLEGPLLGSLRTSESRSVPKNHDQPGLDPIGTRRRSGSHGSWATNLDFLHAGRFKKGSVGLERTHSEHSRRSAFNPFNPSFDPIEPGRLFESPVSPRPSSIASFDNNTLPIPSSDVSAAFGWPASEEMHIPRNRVSLLGTSWSDFRVGGPSRPVSRPISPHANSSSVSLSLAPQQSSWFSTPPQSIRPVTPRLNPAAPTFETRQNSDGPPLLSQPKDSLSVNTSTSTTGSVSGSIETGPTNKDSILSRFSALSRKGSTSKFNLPNWKKDGGFFGRKPKDSSTSDADEPDTPDPGSSSFVANSSPLPWKDKGTGFFGRSRKDVQASDQDDEDEDEGAPAMLFGKEGSPWIKPAPGGGFFGTIGRKRPDKDGEAEVPEVSPVKKEGLQGIFGKKEKKREKREVVESDGEAA